MADSFVRCLVTAGPTREYLDPFRFLSNPSSGKMGFALAEAAAALGWTVDCVAGSGTVPEPDNPDIIVYPVETSEEMYHQVDALYDASDVLIMAAAVSDFRPVRKSPKKLKKAETSLTLELEPTIDILATMTERRRRDQIVMGFAAETHDLAAYARRKLAEKRCDFIAANQIGQPGSGFGSEENTITLFDRDGDERHLGPDTKAALARRLIEIVSEELAARRA